MADSEVENVETAKAKSQKAAEGSKVLPKEKASLPGMMKHLVASVKSMSRKSKIVASSALIATLVISITVAVMLNRVHYTTLYSGLNADEAGKILNVLKTDGVDAKMQGTDTILVPEDKADELRVTLAADGYPQTGLNYDLFTNSSDFGSTDVETRTRLQYTLQENIRATLNNMDKIKDSIVIVNLASNSSYVVSKNTTKASAAVMLELQPGSTLSDTEARSIAQFVIKSVPDLELENVSIVDSAMHTYDLTGNSESDQTYSASQMQLAEQMKKILSDQVLKILEPVMGSGNVTASVNLTLNFDKETQNSVEFSAPIEGETEGMLRSLEETANNSKDTAGTNGAAGTDSNGVSGTEYMASNGSGNSSNSSTKTYNYELNELQKQIEKAQGKVADLSVSVLLNSDADGASAVQSQAKELVANAIGVDQQYISIASLPFVESAGEKGFDDYYQQSQDAMKRASVVSILKAVLICLTLLTAVVLVLRFLKKRNEPEEKAEAANAGARMIDGIEQKQAKTNEELLDLVKAKSNETEKVERLVEDYPEAVVQILRGWLTDN